MKKMILELMVGFVVMLIMFYIAYTLYLFLFYLSSLIKEKTNNKYGISELLMVIAICFLLGYVSFLLGKFLLNYSI